MITTIYADVLFLINFFINMTLLKITSVFMKRNAGLIRTCLSSCIGSLYAVCMFFPYVSFLYIFPVKIMISVIMIKIIYPGCGFVRLIKSCAVFLLVSFTFAGVLLALIYFTGNCGQNSAILNNGIFYFNIPMTTIIATTLISYLLITISAAIFRKNKSLGIKKIKIFLRGKECEITALSDTGNLLCDPISQNPVIIAEKNSVKTLFPEGVPDYPENFSDEINLRIIPYSSIGKSGGMMTGFIPDMVTVEGRKTKDAVIAITESSLSVSDDYNALFNPDIII